MPVRPLVWVSRALLLCSVLWTTSAGAQETAGAQAAPQAEHHWQIGLTPSFLSGDYGQGSTTDITYVPLSIQRLFSEGDVSLVIPAVRITGDCSVTLLSGVPNRTGQGCPSRGDPRVTEQGLGDIVVRGRYYLFDEKEWTPEVALIGRIKIPTADESRGLGTGEWDEGGGLEMAKSLTDRWVAYLDGGYIFIGKPPGVPLHNQWYYDVGLGYFFTKDLVGSLYYEEWRTVVAGFQNPQDLLFTLNYAFSQAIRANASTLIGLSDGAPDYGLTVGFTARF